MDTFTETIEQRMPTELVRHIYHYGTYSVSQANKRKRSSSRIQRWFRKITKSGGIFIDTKGDFFRRMVADYYPIHETSYIHKFVDLVKRKLPNVHVPHRVEDPECKPSVIIKWLVEDITTSDLMFVGL